MLLHVDVEMLNHLLPHLIHPLVYLFLHVRLQTAEGCINLLLTAALLINLPDAALNVYIVSLAQYLVACPKHIVEELELVVEQFKHSHICIIPDIDEVDHHNIEFLSVSMASSDALLDALRVPAQVEIDDQRTELQVETFGWRLGGYHNLCLILEVVNNSGSAVGSLDATHLVGMLSAPPFIYIIGLRLGCLSIEKNHLAVVAVCLKKLA